METKNDQILSVDVLRGFDMFSFGLTVVMIKFFLASFQKINLFRFIGNPKIFIKV